MSAQVIIERSVERIARDAVPQDTVSLARWLLGKVLVGRVRGVQISGRIVETEAYLQHEPACHGFRGVTPRNRSLFLEHGRAYVYLCYGTSYMLNVSGEAEGIGSGVLLRALEPLSGIEQMRRDSHEIDAVGVSVRIGLTKAADERLRFFVAGSRWLSGPKTLNAWRDRTG
jgi:DNA-3-methyladenine glycosylase